MFFLQRDFSNPHVYFLNIPLLSNVSLSQLMVEPPSSFFEWMFKEFLFFLSLLLFKQTLPIDHNLSIPRPPRPPPPFPFDID